MSSRKKVGFVLTIAVLLMAAFVVNTAFGAGFDKAPGEEHPPACHRLEFFAPGILGLECTDNGADIINVGVKTRAKYELTWDKESVVLYVYVVEKGATSAEWFVEDSLGSIVTGTLK